LSIEKTTCRPIHYWTPPSCCKPCWNRFARFHAKRCGFVKWNAP